MCFCCVRFSVSIPSQEIGLGNVSEMTYFVSSGTYNHNSGIQAEGRRLSWPEWLVTYPQTVTGSSWSNLADVTMSLSQGQTNEVICRLVVVQTTTMMPAVTEVEQSSPEMSSASAGSKEDEMNNNHVLRQAQLARELQQLNEMLADKQQLAGQMMRSDEQLASVKLQYEVSNARSHLLLLLFLCSMAILPGETWISLSAVPPRLLPEENNWGLKVRRRWR